MLEPMSDSAGSVCITPLLLLSLVFQAFLSLLVSHILQSVSSHPCMCCSHGFIDNLQLGGPTPIGARKAPLSEKYLSMMQEVALNEQVCCDQSILTVSNHVTRDTCACMVYKDHLLAAWSSSLHSSMLSDWLNFCFDFNCYVCRAMR